MLFPEWYDEGQESLVAHLLLQPRVGVCPIPLMLFWDRPFADDLAEADGIDPPTGVEFFNVLKKLHPKADWRRGEEGRLIRWS